MSNRKDGTDFEKEFCEILAEHGFWCHNLAQKASGQPFDVIIARRCRTYPVDCKVCKNDKFDTRRIEDNQKLAMTKWRKCGNNMGWFALKLSNGDIYMVSHRAIEEFRCVTERKIMNVEDMAKNGWLLERWLVHF